MPATPATSDRQPAHRWIVAALSIVAAVALIGGGLLVWAMSQGPTYGWGMMGGSWGGGWGWMWGVGLVMMIVPLVLFVALLFLLLRPSYPTPVLVSSVGPASPENEVRVRYARGEITDDQYRRILENLRGN